MSKKILRIGILQYTPVWEDPLKSIKKIEKFIPSKLSIDLLVFPEMFLTGFTNKPHLAIDESHEAFQWLTHFSKQMNIYLIGTILFKEKNGNLYNRLFFVGPNGIIDTYDKRHLFTYLNEHQTISQGNTRKLFELQLSWGTVRIFPAICYDLRFPKWLFNDLNYDIMVIPAAWPQERIKAWEILLRARAIENQAFVVGVNTYGKDKNGIFYGGYSLLPTFPYGESLIPPIHGEQFTTVTADVDYIYHMRQEFPFLKDAD